MHVNSSRLKRRSQGKDREKMVNEKGLFSQLIHDVIFREAGHAVPVTILQRAWAESIAYEHAPVQGNILASLLQLPNLVDAKGPCPVLDHDAELGTVLVFNYEIETPLPGRTPHVHGPGRARKPLLEIHFHQGK